MQSLATEFSVDPAAGPEDFLQAIVHWLTAIQHTALPADGLHALPGNIARHLQALAAGTLHPPPSPLISADASERLQVLATTGKQGTLAGISHHRRDGAVLWSTTAVHAQQPPPRAGNAPETWIGIRVSSSADDPMQRLPVDREPTIVPTLLEQLGGGPDGLFTASARAHHLRSGQDLILAGSTLMGNGGSRMPIVYVSATFQPGHAIDPDRLASKLAGMAHVLAEPSNAFSRQLQSQTGGINVYGGSVGIYWPEGGEKRRFFLGQKHQTAAELSHAIREDIRRTLINRRPLPLCTWTHLRESVSRNTIATLKSSGSVSVEDYIHHFDEELAASEQKLQDAETEIRRLEQELRRARAHTASQHSLLSKGHEHEFFDNEILAVLLDALKLAQEQNTTRDSRREHILQSVLDANPRPTPDIAQQNREALKALLRDYSTLNAPVRRALEKMGFSITDGGKHYKLVYMGDDRYTYTLPASGSDHRGGLNAALDIGRLMF